MKKSHITLLSILFIIILIISVIFIFKDKQSNQSEQPIGDSAENALEESDISSEEETITYENDDNEEPSKDTNISNPKDDENVCIDIIESSELTSRHYEKMMSTYRKAISEQWDPEQLYKFDLGPVQYSPEPLSKEYGYQLIDINNDGKPEMLLGSQLDDGRGWIDEIYTLVNNRPVKIFSSGIRHGAEILCDGTIAEHAVIALGEGVSETAYYELSNNGVKNLKVGYQENAAHGTYQRLNEKRESMEEISEAEVEKSLLQYQAIEYIEPLFTPFLSEAEVEKSDKEAKLTDDEIEKIVRENYDKIEGPLIEVNVSNLFDKYYDVEDAQEIWESGVDPNHPFYKDIHDLFYPEVEELVLEDGMEFLINEAYALFWQPTEPISFYGPAYDLEVLAKESDRFAVKQTKIIGPQDIGGTSYDVVYIIEYEREDGKWMLAGAKKQK